MSDLIGPLTAAGWASFRNRHDDRGSLPSCCGTVSDFRDAVFYLLRNHDDVVDHHGNVIPAMVGDFRAAYWDMVNHGLPERGEHLIDRLARYYLGDPPAPATELDRMHGDEVYVELCNMTGQPTVTSRPTRIAVCALPIEHRDYRYLVLHVDLRRVDPDAGPRWAVRWGEYIFVLDDDFEHGNWEVTSSCPDDVDLDTWRRHREFPLPWAMRVAQEQAVRVDVNGRTAADIIAADQARAVTR